MSNTIKITIDGVAVETTRGKTIFEAARENGIFIPTLCNVDNVKPKGSCRICSVYISGRLMTACTTQVEDGMEIENDTAKLNDMRKAIVELLFVEGNHFCPGCERSGSCELQALGYRFLMMVPRFSFLFQTRDIEATNPKLMKDNNRCIMCKRCIRGIKDEDGKSFFAFARRGHKVVINLDRKQAAKLTDDLARQAMEICPVGALILKGKGFDVPIGRRKYDTKPIGSDVEAKGGNC
ncbi:MAG: (2Fe-2S)-binding protein [Candidatus Cloacimonetes bacterium]|nr:(2Fe-2S)-binding protein [Candidatus Cloacimonadota bacterium]